MADEPTRFHDSLGHDVRSDPWLGQGRSSYVLALDSLRAGRLDDAVALASLTVQEAQEAFDLYALWLVQLPDLLADRGVPPQALDPTRRAAAVTKQQLEAGWTSYLSLVEGFETAARTRSVTAAAGVLESARTTWLAAHDPATDCLAGLLALASQHLGEASVGDLWDAMLSHYYDGIAAKYDPETRPWPDSLDQLGMDIFEAVRGHLSGPDRDGRFSISEDENRWVLQFAPCGSGGRTYPGAEAADRDPDEFTSDEHDWAWQTKGVCLYCVHCCQLQQRAPIERIGIPLRVIEPPVRASSDHPGKAVCTWSIYKDVSKIPAHAWTDVGATPPR
ncbi:hypothetical protein [Aeromicrobium sp. UC242_57]|uniref:hypothetical protein n=1 Tax=Aeromicrobium sp. UC242_57 TaxID=3374624 RepID=UPI0037A3A3C1